MHVILSAPLLNYSGVGGKVCNPELYLGDVVHVQTSRKHKKNVRVHTVHVCNM